MATEAGHIQISEFSKDVIPSINWMMEDLFCQYGVSIPYFMLDYDFPDYSERPDWVSGYNFNLDWGEWGYWLPWFNELLGLLWDEAHLPRLTLPDLSPGSWAFFNDYTETLYDNMQRHYVYDQSGTFTKDEVIEGETSGITGWYKWIDGDGYIHVANKQDASGEPVADFEEEKIVGQTSGTYAYTYEDYWVTQTFSGIDQNPDCAIKYGCHVDSCVDAWDNFDSSPAYMTHKWTGQGCVHHCCSSPGLAPCGDHFARGTKFYLKFNTSGAETGASSAKLQFTISTYTTNEPGDATIRLYYQDYGDAVDTGDYSGGSLQSEAVITGTGEVEMDVDTSVINYSGMTKFKLSLKETDNEQRPTLYGWAIITEATTGIKLILTK